MTVPTARSSIAAGCLIADPGRSGVRRDVEIVLDGDLVAAVRPAERSGGTDWVMPTLADAHDHGRGLPTLAFGVRDEALELWIPGMFSQPTIDVGLLASFAFAKLARSGVGAIVHCHNPQDQSRAVEEAVAVCSAGRAVGVRIAYVVPLMDQHAIGYGDPDHIAAYAGSDVSELMSAQVEAPPIDEQLALVDEIAVAVEGPGVSVQYGPVGPQWASIELLEAVAAASSTTGRRVHMHLFETVLQREWADAQHPDGLLELLDRIDLLSPRLTVAHGIWLDDDELSLLAERGVIVSVNSSSNLRLRSGTARVDRMRALGTPFAFGLDGMSLDDDEDALRELRLSQLLHAGVGLDVGLSPHEALARATSVGHTAVDGSTVHGVVAPGAPADLVVLDGAAIAADVAPGACDELTLLVARACARHVRQVIVAGRVIVDDGRVTGVDEPSIAEEIADACRSAADDLAARRPLLDAHRSMLAAFYRDGGHRRPRDRESEIGV